jgi:NAD(P)-dependent dehydrogenase (short-subunit alcohol dehydrogenase family)
MADKTVFKGKVALISGAGSGIGLELAKEFGRCGATVIGTDINQSRVDDMVKTLTGMGITARGYRVDHTSAEEVQNLFTAVTADVGPVDILCCNAGVGHSGIVGSIPFKEWKWVLDINLWGVIYMVEIFVPLMIKRKTGWVLLTSSGAGFIAAAGMAPYNASKFAVLGIGETMYQELKVHGIGVSVLCPGIIATNIIADGVIAGKKNKEQAMEIYKPGSSRSVHPSVVAKDAVAGLAAEKPVILAPLKHLLAADIIKRISRKAFLDMGARLYKKGRNFVGPLVGKG